VAISNNRILSINNGTTRFKYRDRRDHDMVRIMSLAASPVTMADNTTYTRVQRHIRWRNSWLPPNVST